MHHDLVYFKNCIQYTCVNQPTVVYTTMTHWVVPLSVMCVAGVIVTTVLNSINYHDEGRTATAEVTTATVSSALPGTASHCIDVGAAADRRWCINASLSGTRDITLSYQANRTMPPVTQLSLGFYTSPSVISMRLPSRAGNSSIVPVRFVNATVTTFDVFVPLPTVPTPSEYPCATVVGLAQTSFLNTISLRYNANRTLWFLYVKKSDTTSMEITLMLVAHSWCGNTSAVFRDATL